MMPDIYFERIEVGDLVLVYKDNASPELARVVVMPHGAGELLQVKYEENGLVQAINQYGLKFETLEKVIG